MSALALIFAVLRSGGGATDLGLVLAAGAAPVGLFAVVGGVVADRFDRRSVMVGANVLRALSQAALAALILTAAARIGELAALAAVTGIGDAVFLPAASGLVAESVTARHRGAANALSELAFSTSSMLGPAASGLLITVVSPGVVLAFDAATYVVSAGCLAGLPRAAPAAPAHSTLRQLRAGWSEFASRRWLWSCSLQFVFFHALVLAPYFVLGPVIGAEHLGGSRGWGLVQGALGLGAVLGGVVMVRRRFSRPIRAAVLAQLGWVPAVGALAWPALPLVVLIAAAAIAGFGASLCNVSTETAVQDQIPASSLSTVSGLGWMSSTASMTAGLAVAGTLAGLVGTSALLLTAGALQLVSCLSLLLVRSVRELTWSDAGGDRRVPPGSQ